MAGKNEFLTFGTSAGANTLEQNEYEALPARAGGFLAGIAKSKEMNKVLRQSSIISSMIGEFIADHGYDAIDDSNIQVLKDSFITSIGAGTDEKVAAHNIADSAHADIREFASTEGNRGRDEARADLTTHATAGDAHPDIRAFATAEANRGRDEAKADLAAHNTAGDAHADIRAAIGNIRPIIPGQMIAMFTDVPPDGMLVCNGALVSREAYPALFAAIGTKYGEGDGASTFGLPNLPTGYALLAAGTVGVGNSTAGAVMTHAHGAQCAPAGGHTMYAGTGFTKSPWEPAGPDVAYRQDIDVPAHGHNVTIEATGVEGNFAAGVHLLTCIAY